MGHLEQCSILTPDWDKFGLGPVFDCLPGLLFPATASVGHGRIGHRIMLARAGARQDRLAEPGLQHSPPGDAGTARRGMKTVQSSALRQKDRDA